MQGYLDQTKGKKERIWIKIGTAKLRCYYLLRRHFHFIHSKRRSWKKLLITYITESVFFFSFLSEILQRKAVQTLTVPAQWIPAESLVVDHFSLSKDWFFMNRWSVYFLYFYAGKENRFIRVNLPVMSVEFCFFSIKI